MDASKTNKPMQSVPPFRPSNLSPNPAHFPGHGIKLNAPGGQNVGQQSAQVVGGVGQANQKLTKKQKRQRAMASGSGNASGDPNQAAVSKATADDDKAEDQLGVVETYADYKPAKLDFGAPHPDAVVETATLSSIEPNDITYELSIPKRVIEKGQLSALQLESIVYASQAHEKMFKDGQRAGFLIGDGAGVGKGRTVAGVIFENFQKGRKKAIWVSVSNDLKFDAERDLTDIGAPNIDVWPLHKIKYGKIFSKMNGYKKEGVIFSTYSSLISGTTSGGISANFNSRLKQLVDWCGPDFDGVIIFDECHKAKNLVTSAKSEPTKTGQAVLDLQVALPLARVVYASATGASEPRNMAYMVRLGLWGDGTPFRNFPEFLRTVERRGVGAMEIVAMDMKLRGMYIARQLSFKGATFQVDEVPLSDEFKRAYNDSVQLWVEAKDKFEEASVLFGPNRKAKGSMWAQFWGAHQRYFKYMCIASKVSYAVEVADQAVKDGKCVVIGLQSTGEARTVEHMEQAGGELDDFVPTLKAVFENLVLKQFPAPNRRFAGGKERKVEKTPKRESSGKRKSRSSSSKPKPKSSDTRRVRSPAAKKPRVTYSDDDSDSDVVVISSDDDASQGKKKPSDMETDSGSDSDDENSSSGESESSLGTGSSGDDSDIDMNRNVRRRPHPSTSSASTSVNSTMQDKILEEVQKQLITDSPEAKEATMNMCKRACDLQDELLDKIHKLGRRLPVNTLDQLIEELGGPDEVAEMTGRKGRVVKTDSGKVEYESRCQGDSKLESVNMDEKKRFMDGEKLIAIISEAASNGISLQSDRRAINQLRRVHITLELPWSADRAIQQFGRTHRSNQMNAPEYVFLISNLAGERRFASSVSKRLESLGALTHGDRRATETRNLSQFNVETKYGREALRTVCEKIFDIEDVHLTGDETEEEQEHHAKLVQVNRALKGVAIEHPIHEITITKFLNRILGVPVDLQNYLFDYFTETLAAIIETAKRLGKYDLGIMDMGNTDNAEKIESLRFMREHVTGVAPIDVTTVALQRGMSWEDAKLKSAEITHDFEGFYQTKHNRHTGRHSVCLALLIDPEGAKPSLNSKWKKFNVEFQTHRPHTGTQVRPEKYDEVLRKGDKITPAQAEKLWNYHHNSSIRQCSHMFWDGKCKTKTVGMDCDVGMSRRKYMVLSGSIFAYWNEIEHFVRRNDNSAQIQMIRLKMTDGSKIVGVLLPDGSADALIEDLRKSSKQVKPQGTVTVDD